MKPGAGVKTKSPLACNTSVPVTLPVIGSLSVMALEPGVKEVFVPAILNLLILKALEPDV